MRFYILIFLLLLSCFNKTDSTKEDISSLIEISLNACNDAKQYFHFEIKERRNVSIVFKRIKNPLIRQIKCYDVLVNENSNEKGNLIEVLDYKRSANNFFLMYKIVNEGAVVEVNLNFKNGKWQLLNCSIVEV